MSLKEIKRCANCAEEGQKFEYLRLELKARKSDKKRCCIKSKV